MPGIGYISVNQYIIQTTKIHLDTLLDNWLGTIFGGKVTAAYQIIKKDKSCISAISVHPTITITIMAAIET